MQFDASSLNINDNVHDVTVIDSLDFYIVSARFFTFSFTEIRLFVFARFWH